MEDSHWINYLLHRINSEFPDLEASQVNRARPESLISIQDITPGKSDRLQASVELKRRLDSRAKERTHYFSEMGTLIPIIPYDGETDTGLNFETDRVYINDMSIAPRPVSISTIRLTLDNNTNGGIMPAAEHKIIAGEDFVSTLDNYSASGLEEKADFEDIAFNMLEGELRSREDSYRSPLNQMTPAQAIDALVETAKQYKENFF